jgi:cation transport regulator ChaC
VSLSITELRNRFKATQDKFELLKLREDVTALMDSPQFQQLSQSDRNRVEDLLVEVVAKEEQYKGCDPWRTIMGY